MPERLRQLTDWLRDACELGEFRIEPASGDASFRRYFRVRRPAGQCLIAMDAPPDREDCRPFVAVAETLQKVGLHVPRVHALDLAKGFLLLEDLGTTQFLDVLDEVRVDRLYGDALGALAAMQACAATNGMPSYDRALLRQELELFRRWLCTEHLGLNLAEDEHRTLDTVFTALEENALGQPAVFVHRDYHSRNLMVAGPPNPGILDFQDAVTGPVTYDLVSLLKDAYIRWPLARVEGWAWGYFDLAVQSGILQPAHEASFQRWFDLMGVQRHVKVAGIFARLWQRDGKPGYLRDIPLVLDYVLEIAPRYSELEGLARLIERRVAPRLGQAA